MVSTIDLFFSFIFAVILVMVIVSFVIGKLEGGLTNLLLILFQGIWVYNFTPIALESQRNVTITPGISVSMIISLLILIFIRNKNMKIGAASYLVGMALLSIPIILSSI